MTSPLPSAHGQKRDRPAGLPLCVATLALLASVVVGGTLGHLSSSTPAQYITVETDDPVSITQSARNLAWSNVGNTCSADPVNTALQNGAWKAKSRSASQHETFPSHCRFLSSRFACPGAFSSADDYVFDFSKTKTTTCNVDLPAQTFVKLAPKTRSVLLCGDEHMAQLYQTMLCMLSDQLVMADVTNSDNGETHTIDVLKDPSASFPHCHDTDSERRRRFDRPIMDHLSSSCQYSPYNETNIDGSLPSAVSCATFQDRSVTGVPNGLTVCLMETAGRDPYVAATMCAAGASTGPPLVHQNSLGKIADTKSFDAIVGNTQINLEALVNRVRGQPLVSRSSSVVVLPRPGIGGQIVTDLLARQASATQPSTNDEVFSTLVGNTAFTSDTNGVKVSMLDMQKMLNARQADSKIARYPMTGIPSGSFAAERTVCCASPDDPNCNCESKSFTAIKYCRNSDFDIEGSNCLATESLMCAPGPSVAVLQGVLSVLNT